MTDLLHVLPEIDLTQFTHIVPSLEKALITSSDLLTLDATDVAKRAQVPPAEVKRLTEELLKGLYADIGLTSSSNRRPLRQCDWISTLDIGLDLALGGGFPVGYLSEVTGESAAGKTQLLLSLLLSVQLPAPRGLSRSALYISTEAPLQTTRLAQILSSNPSLSDLPASSEKPSLGNIHSTKVSDLEAQEHVLRYQVPVLIARNNIGLLIIDSVAANFRAEFDSATSAKRAEVFAKRSAQLIKLGQLLRALARDHGIAVVVANQVLDRFTPAATAFEAGSQQASQRPRSRQSDRNTGKAESEQQQPAANGSGHTETLSPPALSTLDPLSFDHQQRFFTGWGDMATGSIHNLKTPSLGLTWTNQLAMRIALLKDPIMKYQDYVLGNELEVAGWKRYCKLVFAEWVVDDNGRQGTQFEIWEGGIRAIDSTTEDVR